MIYATKIGLAAIAAAVIVVGMFWLAVPRPGGFVFPLDVASSSLMLVLSVAFSVEFTIFKHDKEKATNLKREISKRNLVAKEIGCQSDIGRVREIDEDSVFVAKVFSTCDGKPRQKVFMIVADGMGGHSKGEVASAIGVSTVAGLMVPQIIAKEDTVSYSALLGSFFKDANGKILQHAIDHPECEGMGTTMTATLIDPKKMYIGHIGDTRAYVFSEDKAKQITKDDSLVQQMVDKGEITPEQARVHPQKNVITKVVGYYNDMDASVYEYEWEKNDRVLMCCDGLIAHVEDKEIAATVLCAPTTRSACKDLIDQANKRGGKDNISVIVTPPLSTLFEN